MLMMSLPPKRILPVSARPATPPAPPARRRRGRRYCSMRRRRAASREPWEVRRARSPQAPAPAGSTAARHRPQRGITRARDALARRLQQQGARGGGFGQDPHRDLGDDREQALGAVEARDGDGRDRPAGVAEHVELGQQRRHVQAFGDPSEVLHSLRSGALRSGGGG